MARTRSTEALRALDSKRCEMCGGAMRRGYNQSRRAFGLVRFCSRACAGASMRGVPREARKLTAGERAARRDRDRELQRALDRALGRGLGPVCPHCTVRRGTVEVTGHHGGKEVWCEGCARYAPSRKGMVVLGMRVGMRGRDEGGRLKAEMGGEE